MTVERTGLAPAGTPHPVPGAWRRALAERITHPFAALLVFCVALAALSLLLSSAPTYDPWAWLVWGREIAHLQLHTTDGPSWKPLPVMITTALAPTGSAAPWLWLVVARTGGLLALAMTFRVASRLAGPAAGLIAAAGLVLSHEWLRDAWLGNSEGLVLAFLLLAVDRHLMGRRGQALTMAFLAGLLRPEVWPFLGLYGLWLWVREPALRRLGLALGLLTPLLWLVPEEIGSGNLFRASARAKLPAPGSNVPALSDHPGLTLLSNSAGVVIAPVIAGLGVALVMYLRRRRLERATLLLGFWVLAWVALVAVMTQAGYSGNQRYLIAPGGIACVVAGVGWARLGADVAQRAGRVAVAALALALVAGSVPWIGPRIDLLRQEARILRHEANVQSNLPRAIRAAGGAAALRRCGPAVTEPFQVTRVAWALRVHINDVLLVPERRGVIFQAPLVPASPPRPLPAPGYRLASAAGPWHTYTACAPRVAAG